MQCPYQLNFFVFWITSEKENPVPKGFDVIRIFAPFSPIFTLGGTKTLYTLKQTCKFQLQVCLSMYALFYFLVALCSKSRSRPLSNVWNHVMFLFWFGSYKQLRNNSQRNCWSPFCVILFLYTVTDIITHNAL